MAGLVFSMHPFPSHQVFVALPEEIDPTLFNQLSLGAMGLLCYLVGRKGLPVSAEALEAMTPEYERPLVNSYLWELHEKKLIASFQEINWEKMGHE